MTPSRWQVQWHRATTTSSLGCRGPLQRQSHREFQRRRLSGAAGSWELDGDYAYGIFLSSDASSSGAVVGGVGLHRRRGPNALEIGYWVHVAHIRKGFASAAASAVTSAGFSMAGIQRIEIRCDAANDASAAVPRKLGFRLVDTIEMAPEAPAEVGRRLCGRSPRTSGQRVKACPLS